MFQDYYKILGLTHTASADEIKKAYRMLALKYHPDKNKTASAHNHFVEINEAYQVLSDAYKKDNYDYLYRRYILNKEPQPEPEPQPTYTYRPQYQRREYAEQDHGPEIFSEKTNTFIKRTCQVAIALSLFLLTDFFLPKRISHEHLLSSNLLVQYQTPSKRTGRLITQLENYNVLRTENYVVFYEDPPNYMSIGNKLAIHSTRILDVPVKAIYEEYDGFEMEVDTQYGLYDLYVAYIIMLIISVISLIIIKKKIHATQTLVFFMFVNFLVFVWVGLIMYIYISMR